MEGIKILQSELKTREATAPEQEELDRRASDPENKDLFDPEPGAEKKPEKKEEKKEEKAEPEKKTEDKTADAEILEAEDDELNDEQKARKAELVEARDIIEKQEKDDKLLETEDKDLEEAELARKKELLKEKEGSKTDEEKKAELEAEIKEYATEHSMSEDDARKDIESIGKIVDNFKGDPRKLAKSFHHMQRIAASAKEEAKALKNAPPPLQSKDDTMKTLVKGIEDGKMPLNGKPVDKEVVVAAYRKQNPDIAEDVSDDTVVKLIAREVMGNLESKRQENLTKLSSESKEKKAKLIGELSEDDKKYLPTIKAMVDGHTDSQIMSEGYDLEDYIRWARGDKETMEKTLKEREARGYKRGVEARKIVGEIKKPVEGTTKTKTSATSTNDFGLNKDQKAEAEGIYANDSIPLSRKYELFAEIIKDEKKEKKED